MRRPQRGSRIGDWLLEERLGKGGNAEVWRAGRPDGTGAAIKILQQRRSDSEPYKRFRDEVGILRSLGARPGLLPLIDASLPARPSQGNPAWLAMPVATPIKEALGDGPRLEQVVEAIAAVADALASLAAEGIAHRDVKPSNLYRYSGAYAVGDFGLVDFPDKQALTVPGRRLGPLFFLAPEMLSSPESADGRPSDVYSLAKTLWVSRNRPELATAGRTATRHSAGPRERLRRSPEGLSLGSSDRTCNQAQPR